MEKVTNEKSLVKIDEKSFFSRFRRFWVNIFNRRKNNKSDDEKVEEVELIIEESPSESLNTNGKLFNYDAQDNEENNNKIADENNIVSDKSDVSREDLENGKITYESMEISNDNDDMNVTYLFEKKEKTVVEEREELERKLMNYYESIKNSIQ